MSTHDDTPPGGTAEDDQAGNVASLTLKLLGQIRDEARQTNQRLDATNQRLDATNQRLDGTNERLDAGFERLDRRIDELTYATVHGFGEVNRRIDHLLLGPHRDEHQDLRRRVERLEANAGFEAQIPK